ncbi:hypothetical protein, partial [Escherichia coli]|uniref:hypothetical protein n=1 Tax=Escherichia coli TaxID=562 RepID=UPI001F12DE5B
DPVLQPEASSPGAKDENTGAGLCRSRLVVQERLGHYKCSENNPWKIVRSTYYFNGLLVFA